MESAAAASPSTKTDSSGGPGAASSLSSSSTSIGTRILTDHDDFIKPQVDTRQYRAIRLANGLDCLLVSHGDDDDDDDDDDEEQDHEDEESGSSSTTLVEAGAVHVKVGHAHDTRPGLAHFHEHIVFLGSQKYPDENEYERFLNQHGGSSNAYTGFEDTNYYFSISSSSSSSGSSGDETEDLLLEEDDDDDQDQQEMSERRRITRTTTPLEGSLDRLAQFFIAPTFDPNMVERELRAIDSEYCNGKTDDAWRNFQLLKSAAAEGHAFGQFGCGNYETLTKGGRILNATHSEPGQSLPLEDLRAFWTKYYSTTEYLRLAVVGRASLDELQGMVERTFGHILPSPRTSSSSSDPTTGPVIVNGNSGGSTPTATTTNRASATITSSNTDDDHQDASAFQSVGLFPSERGLLNQHGDGPTSIRAFGPDQLGVQYEVKPVMQKRQLKLYFATPPLDDVDIVNGGRPHRVLSHVLGHEAPGSLYCLLNDQEGWITELTTGIAMDAHDFSLFQISVNLTPKGLKHVDQVISTIYQMIALIRQEMNRHDDDSSGCSRMAAYQDELRQMGQVHFTFRENGDATDFCSDVSDLMFLPELQGHPDDYSKLLLGTSELSGFNATIAKAYWDRIRPSNSLIFLLNSDLEVDGTSWKKEHWYGADYRRTVLTEEQMNEWENPPTIHPDLKLPELNAYIPTDFSLRCDDEEDAVKKSTDANTVVGLPIAESSVSDVSSSPLLKSSMTKVPPKVLIQTPSLRLWHKMDTKWRVPKMVVRLALTSPTVYQSPRTMTLSRLFTRVLNDDLQSFVYDASLAGCHHRIGIAATGYRVSVRGYSQALPALLDTVLSRIVSLMEDMMEGPERHPALASKFDRAKENLLRETQNHAYDTPYEIGAYNARLVQEERVWTLRNYMDELEAEDHVVLTMEECGRVARECFNGRRVRGEGLVMGNVNTKQAKEVGALMERHFFSRTSSSSSIKDDDDDNDNENNNQERAIRLVDTEMPVFRAMKFPTRDEAAMILGRPPPTTKTTDGHEQNSMMIPLVYQEVATSESEENHSVEIILQCGCDSTLGYEGIAMLNLIGHLAYNSAYETLRTKEQLGYIVSAVPERSEGQARSLSIVVQSSVATPRVLEERMEAWLQTTFREELLQDMSPEQVMAEGQAVIGMLLERETKMAQEISHMWGAILLTEGYPPAMMQEPDFYRTERVADELRVIMDDTDSETATSTTTTTTTMNGTPRKTAIQLKERMLEFFDTYFAVDAPERRGMVSRVYSPRHDQSERRNDEKEDEEGGRIILNRYEDIRHVKQYLGTYPVAPFWSTEMKNRNS